MVTLNVVVGTKYICSSIVDCVGAQQKVGSGVRHSMHQLKAAKALVLRRLYHNTVKSQGSCNRSSSLVFCVLNNICHAVNLILVC